MSAKMLQFPPAQAMEIIRAAKARAGASIGGYSATGPDNFGLARWTTTGSDADGASLPDIPKLREQSRDLLRNSPLSTGAIGTVVLSVAGTGLSLFPRPDIKTLGWTREYGSDWASKSRREWRLWAENADCDATRSQNFYGLQALAFRSALESGDVFALLPFGDKASPYRLQIQLVEADRVANPTRMTLDGARLENGNRVFAGVEKNNYGAPVAYHILKNHPGSVDGARDYEVRRYAAFGKKTGRRNVIHLFDRLRPDQSRGVPYLAPVISALHQLGRYTEAELSAAVITGSLTGFIKTPAPNEYGALPADEGGQTNVMDLGIGTLARLDPGLDVVFPDAKRPNNAFDPFVQAVLGQIGVALGLPHEVLIKHFRASYSASRAALLEAWKFFSVRREWLAAGFCQPVYEAWMDEAVSLGRISAPGYFDDPLLRTAYLGCEWRGDAPGSIDPVKDAKAARERLSMHLTTLEEEAMAYNGSDWEEIYPQIVREREMLSAAGLALPPQSAKGTGGVPAPPDSDDNDDEDEDV